MNIILASFSTLLLQYPQKSLVDDSMNVLIQTFEKYPLESIYISFNGGKDAVAVLFLTLATLLKHISENCIDREPESKFEVSSVEERFYEAMNRIQYLYIKEEGQFPEEFEYIQEIVNLLGIQLTTKEGGMADITLQLAETHQLQAAILGTRRTDPYSKDLEYFTQSTPQFGNFMRVFPILDWKYAHIWNFIHYFKIPYCLLYDKGYTSIGRMNNTWRNPCLKLENGNYLPAYKLEDQEQERAGRVKDPADLQINNNNIQPEEAKM